MAEPIVILRDISMRYEARDVLSSVNLRVDSGETMILIGHNGAGKTTLIKILLGLVQPNTGTVRVMGTDPRLHATACHHTQIGYLPENAMFSPAMTGLQVLNFYARLKRVPIASNPALLHKCGLAEEAIHRRVNTYSKGMRQRLGLAQAILGEPKLLVLDEPTTGLDPNLRSQFYDIIHELQCAGTTLIISSHALHEIEEHADRIAIMQKGRQVAFGTLQELNDATDLPVVFTITAAPGCSTRLLEQLETVNVGKIYQENDRITMHCHRDDKMTVIQRLAAMDQVITNLDIKSPNLEEIYAHYVKEEACK